MPDIDEIIRRGVAAEALLNNSLLNEAFESVLTKISKQWLVTKREAQIDVQGREELHARAQAVTELRAELTRWMNDAIKTQSDLNKAQKRQEAKNG